MQLHIIQFPPLPCYPIPLRSKYLHQHPILIHREPVFLPQRDRPSFTPIQKPGKIRVLYTLEFLFFGYHVKTIIRKLAG